MNNDSLTTLLRESQHEIHRHQYTNALKIIRDAKIIDLHNIYLSALEHFVAKLPYPSSEEFTEIKSMENEHILSLLIERVLNDRERRIMKRSEGFVMPDEKTLAIEKIKNQYFQRTDEMIEAKEYSRALEEVRRVYFFDPSNFVAKEYELKIQQLSELHKKE